MLGLFTRATNADTGGVGIRGVSTLQSKIENGYKPWADLPA